MEKKKLLTEDSPLEKKFGLALATSFASPHVLAGEYLSKHIRGRQSLGLRRERVFNLKDKGERQTIKKIFRERLSQETQKILKKNYEKTTLFHIIETLQNFEIPILIADKSIELSKKMKKAISPFKENLLKALADIDSLLKNEIVIKDDESFKDILLRQKMIFEGIKSQFVPAKADEAVLTKLYDIYLDPLGFLGDSIRYYDDEQWMEKYMKLSLFVNLVGQPGRPYKIFWKGLQVIIYDLLTVNPPKTITHYVQWAKKLTAATINEFFERWKTPPTYPEGTPGYSATLIYKNYGPWSLPILTTKNIDNSLHSTR